MKRTAPPARPARLLAFLSCLIGLQAWAGASLPLPTPFPEVRYRQMSVNSPFAIATAAVAAAAPTPGFAAQLYVDGIAHLGNTDFVAIKSRNPDPGQAAVILIEVGKQADNGMKVERIKWSGEIGKSTVDVSMGGEKATLEFDEATIKTAASAPVAPGVPGNPAIQAFLGHRRRPMIPVPN